jgi:ElaB/YqjD/DUF883 family membrane-anchored ribosome-binding protein
LGAVCTTLNTLGNLNKEFTVNTTELAREMSAEAQAEVTKEQLMADFRVVINDAEALLKATANQTGDKLAATRAKVEESLQVARARLAEAQSAVVAKTKAAAKATDAYVHENPWNAVGIAAAVGLLVGILIGRRH